MTFAVSAADVTAARGRIAGLAHHTPVLTSATLDAQCGAELFFKAENFQRTGSFKFRGAANALARLPNAQRAAGVIAFSSGNHAQAVACAAALAGVSATIVMPHDAPRIKRDATAGYGAQLVFYDRVSEDREVIAQAVAIERGLTLIPPFNHPDIIAGQGTAAAELLDEIPNIDILVACVGGGGLLAGSALAAQAAAPACRVFGVEPQAGNDAQISLRTGVLTRIPVPVSIADGALTQQLGPLTFPIIRARVADILAVPDDALTRAMRIFAERMKIVVEPTGCLAAAAIFSGLIDIRGRRIGVILSGGNVDLSWPDAPLARTAEQVFG